jgi:hypothetical protein
VLVLESAEVLCGESEVLSVPQSWGVMPCLVLFWIHFPVSCDHDLALLMIFWPELVHIHFQLHLCFLGFFLDLYCDSSETRKVDTEFFYG